MLTAIYCRVSSVEQTLDQQLEPLIRWCFDHEKEYIIFAEKISGAKESRRELDKMMMMIRNREIDTVLVYKLDRLGRSLKHLIQLIEEFNNRGVQFVCLSPEVNTKSAQGMFFIQIIGAVAQLERELIRERTQLKLNYLKSKGVKLGRPEGSKDKEKRRRSGYWQRWAKQSTPK